MLRSFATASALFVLAVASAGAQPATRPEPRAEMCGVTFVRAPDDVRYVIEQWLRAEPRCSSTIELRVVPTDGGLYLIAQRPDGRIHERLVPDAQTAGVLVASWVADDWTASQAQAGEPVPPPLAPPPMAPLLSDPPRGTPGAVGVLASAQPRPRHRGKWLSFGIVVEPDHGGGFRAEADLLGRGSWKLGGVISYSESDLELMGAAFDYGSLTARDLKVLATLSRTWTWGRWDLRGGIGIGALHTNNRVEGRAVPTVSDPNGGYQSGSSKVISTALEVSGLVSRRLGRSWGVGLGPVITFGEWQESRAANQQLGREVGTFMIFGGVRYEL